MSWQYKPRNDGVKPLELNHSRLFPRPHDELVELLAKQVEVLINHTGVDKASLPERPVNLDNRLNTTTAIEDFRTNLEIIISSLKFPMYDAASIRFENAQIQRDIEARTGKTEKIDSCFQRERDGTGTAYSLRFQTLVTIAHHGDLKEEQFLGCRAIFIDSDNKQHTLLTKTFINYLAKGEQLGLPEKRLSELLALFSRVHLPQLGDLSRHGKDNTYNKFKIINALDPFAEKRVIQNSLRRLTRYPGINVLDYTPTLDHHYEKFLSIGKLGTLEEGSFLGARTNNEDEEKTRLKFLKTALLGLMSAEAQRQFFLTCDVKKFTELTLEQFQLLAMQADRQHPPKGNIQLPTHVSLLSEEGTGQFGPDQIVLCPDDMIGLLAMHVAERGQEGEEEDGDHNWDLGAASIQPGPQPMHKSGKPWDKTIHTPIFLAPTPANKPGQGSRYSRSSRRDGGTRIGATSPSPSRNSLQARRTPPPANPSPGPHGETRVSYIRRKAGTQGLPANLLALRDKGGCLACNSFNHWVRNCPNFPKVAKMAANSTHHRDLPICNTCGMAHETTDHKDLPQRDDNVGQKFSKASPLRPYRRGDSQHRSPSGTARKQTPPGRMPSPSPSLLSPSPKNV